jgi:hypothetical protein
MDCPGKNGTDVPNIFRKNHSTSKPMCLTNRKCSELHDHCPICVADILNTKLRVHNLSLTALTLIHLLKAIHALVELQSSFPCSQNSTSGHYREGVHTSLHIPTQGKVSQCLHLSSVPDQNFLHLGCTTVQFGNNPTFW